MSLVRLKVPTDAATPLPADVERLLCDAGRRIDAFIETYKDNPAAGFVPSDYPSVYHALRWLYGVHLPGDAFCEWGSGMGVIVGIASLIGFDSIGIEIDARLVEASRLLARDHALNVQIVQGSYVPDGHAMADDFNDSHVMTMESGRAAYEELGLDPDDFDCIFAYPWPGEDDVVTSIFDRYAARGAVLVTYHGQDGMMIRRKAR